MVSWNILPRCDDEGMDDAAEFYPLTYSTAYLGLAALITIRNNSDDLFDAEAVDYSTSILAMLRNQPETVLTLAAAELEEMGPHLLDNAKTWIENV